MPNESVTDLPITQAYASFMATYRAWFAIIEILISASPDALGPLKTVYDFFNAYGQAKLGEPATSGCTSSALSLSSSAPVSSSNSSASYGASSSSSSSSSYGASSSSSSSSSYGASSSSSSSSSYGATSSTGTSSSSSQGPAEVVKPKFLPRLPGQVLDFLSELYPHLGNLPKQGTLPHRSTDILLNVFFKPMSAYLEALNADKLSIADIKSIRAIMEKAIKVAASRYEPSLFSKVASFFSAPVTLGSSEISTDTGRGASGERFEAMNESIGRQIQAVLTKQAQELEWIAANKKFIDACDKARGDKYSVRDRVEDIFSRAEGASHYSDNYTLTSLLYLVNELDLFNQKLTEPNIKIIVKALEGHPGLISLNLNTARIDAAGVAVLVAASMGHPTLAEIDLEDCDINDKVVIALADALRNHPALAELNLSDCDIQDEDVTVLAEALEHNRALTSLNLSRGNFIAPGVIALAKALKVNTTLTSLYLSSNIIGTEGVIALAEALKVNTTLTLLDLSGCHIDDKGIIALADMLTVNQTLTSLNLSGSNFTTEGLVVLAAALKNNQTLTSLQLKDNLRFDGHLYHMYKLSFGDMLERHNNGALTELNFGGNGPCPLSNGDNIEQFLEKNRGNQRNKALSLCDLLLSSPSCLFGPTSSVTSSGSAVGASLEPESTFPNRCPLQ